MTAETPYALRDYIRYFEQGLQNFGGHLNGIAEVPDELRAAGFEDVTLTVHKCPMGPWPLDRRLRVCGDILRTVAMDGLRGMSARPLGTGLGWTPLQIEMFLVDVRKAIMDSKIHTYLPYHVVYARKPISEEKHQHMSAPLGSMTANGNKDD
jgi:hypothetical protein